MCESGDQKDDRHKYQNNDYRGHIRYSWLSSVRRGLDCSIQWWPTTSGRIALRIYKKWSLVFMNHGIGQIGWNQKRLSLSFEFFWYVCVFSCPEQLNRWPCHWVTVWLIQWLLILEHKTIHCLEIILEQDIFWQFWHLGLPPYLEIWKKSTTTKTFFKGIIVLGCFCVCLPTLIIFCLLVVLNCFLSCAIFCARGMRGTVGCKCPLSGLHSLRIFPIKKFICQNWNMYLSKLKFVFIKIEICFCQNWKRVFSQIVFWAVQSFVCEECMGE